MVGPGPQLWVCLAVSAGQDQKLAMRPKYELSRINQDQMARKCQLH